jgi:hypothetical protein
VSDVVRDFIDAEIGALTQLVAYPTATDNYGVDLLCINDIDPRAREVGLLAKESLVQDIYHRLITKRGTLSEDDPNYGTDITSFLHAAMVPLTITRYQGQIEDECLKDDRVAECEATISNITQRGFDVSIAITPVDTGSVFKLQLAVTDAGALLSLF